METEIMPKDDMYDGEADANGRHVQKRHCQRRHNGYGEGDAKGGHGEGGGPAKRGRMETETV